MGELAMPSGHQLKTYRTGHAEGRLLGGCLSLITPLLGTKYLPDFTNAILVIEDIDEDTYRLDKHFAQLRLAGILDKLSGIVFGQFIDCEPKKENATPSLTVEEVIADYIEGLNIPIVGHLPYGHGDVKLTLPIGARVILDADKGKLIVPDAVVA
jgi:muramoyltetrapeptide carboxypeptidase